jgi:preprotein translocase subunit YajC
MDPSGLLALGIIFFVFYFIAFRPQKKRMREHQLLISALAAGDEVVTIGGMYGYITDVEDDVIWLEIAENVVVRITKQAIARKMAPAEGAEGEAAEEPGAPADQADQGGEDAGTTPDGPSTSGEDAS